MKVFMKNTTNYKGLKLAGQEYEIENEVATRWLANGIAIPAIDPIIKTEEEEFPHGENIKKEDGISGDDVEEKTYSGMKAKELYEECKSRGIEVEPKQKASFYIGLLRGDDLRAQVEE